MIFVSEKRGCSGSALSARRALRRSHEESAAWKRMNARRVSIGYRLFISNCCFSCILFSINDFWLRSSNQSEWYSRELDRAISRKFLSPRNTQDFVVRSFVFSKVHCRLPGVTNGMLPGTWKISMSSYQLIFCHRPVIVFVEPNLLANVGGVKEMVTILVSQIWKFVWTDISADDTSLSAYFVVHIVVIRGSVDRGTESSFKSPHMLEND